MIRQITTIDGTTFAEDEYDEAKAHEDAILSCLVPFVQEDLTIDQLLDGLPDTDSADDFHGNLKEHLFDITVKYLEANPQQAREYLTELEKTP